MKAKKEMLVRVRYVFEGKEHERVFFKSASDDVGLKKGFETVKEMYVDLQHKQGIRHLSITSELIFDTRPMKYYHTS